MRSSQIDIYINAILSGITNELSGILSPDIEAVSPTSPMILTDMTNITTGLGLVSKIVQGLKLVRIYQASENWHLTVFTGNIDGDIISFSDQLHINDSSLIDRLEIFLWPTSIAGKFSIAISDFLKNIPTSPNP